MEKSEIIYNVNQGQFINKWLISGVVETPLFMTPVPDSFPNYYPGASVKDKHGKERKSPAKQEYLRLGEFKRLAYPENAVTDKLYYPADTGRVDCSIVCKFPEDLRLFARAYVRCEKDMAVPVAMFCCGGMKLWVNGKLEGEYYPYESNIECREDTIIHLKAGENEILVAVNDYGERNIVFRFGLKLLGGPLEVSLPVSADVDLIESMGKCLSGLYLDKLNYREEPMYLCAEEPFPENFDFTVSAEDLDDITCTATKGKKKVKLFEAEDIVSGYHEFTLTTIVDGVEMKAAFCAQVCPKERERQSVNIVNVEERKRFCLQYAAENGNSLDNYIASMEMGDSDFERFRTTVLRDLDFAERRGDCADFKVQRFLWMLAKYQDKLLPEIKERMEKLVLGFRYWFDEPGNDAMWFFSENHALAFHCDEYVAGQMYPDAVFTNSGLTGREHMAKAERRITEWFEKLLKYGYNEWNSATYVNVDVFTFITLYIFAKDEKIKTLAKKALDYTFEMYAYNSFKGVMGTSNGRTYDKDILGSECMSGNSQMWLAWGVGCINRRVSPSVYIAMSDYVPPAEYKAIASGEFYGKVIRSKKEGTMAVPTYLCKTSKYIVGTCVSPRTGGPGSQELLLSMFLNDTGTRIWLNLPGEGKVFGIRRPGYFSGNALTPLVSQKENVVVVSYHFLKAFKGRCDVDYIHIMCDEQECDEVVLKENTLFIRRGDVFAAFISTAPIKRTEKACLKGKEFVTDRIDSDWLIKVSDISEFDSFRSFMEYHRKNRFRIKFSKLIFIDAHMGKLKFPLLTKGYLLKKLNPRKLKQLGVSGSLVKQFLKEIIKKRG